MNAPLEELTPASRFWWGLIASVRSRMLGFGKLTAWERDSWGFSYIAGRDGFLARRGEARRWWKVEIGRDGKESA
jgi:hypothetical protein